MDLQLIGSSAEITNAINAFDTGYHHDFFKVRSIGRRYVTENSPPQIVASALAISICPVLKAWGAGKREAPQLRSEQELTQTFSDIELHRDVLKLSQMSECSLNLDGLSKRLMNGLYSLADLSAFDETLPSVLQSFSERLFIGNTNVTYPMKVLLLISGLMPALDGQVRGGLGKAGFSGVNRTQFLLPRDARSADGKKLTRLPWVLGQCWAEYAPKFKAAITQSNYPMLLQEPGRTFDVLFFMQADEKQTPLLTLRTGAEPWYNLA